MERLCLVCSKRFRTYPCLVRDGKGKYCSKACSDTKTLFLKGHASKATSGSFKSGKDHPKWQGWRYAGRHHKYRLLLLPNHPFADKRGYYREHRYVLEQKLGRYLTPNEEVHHIDGNGLNNDPSNLRLMKNKHYHLKLEHKLGTYKGAYLAMAKSHGRSNIH